VIAIRKIEAVAEFHVAQRPPAAPAFSTDALVWTTCVRQVAFIDGPSTVPEAAQVWHDEEAYQHLLEVICGLHSPIVGETEVLHQFKVFADGLGPRDAGWKEICSRLLADARTIRARHLIGLGSRSYGSVVRRYLRDCRRVAVFGTGMLAKDIVPFIADGGRTIDLWGRRETCSIGAPGLTYRTLGADLREVILECTAIVVAAPLSSADIARHAARYASRRILIDLRAEGAGDPAPAIAPVVSLADVFAGFERTARKADEHVLAAKTEIRQCASVYASRARLNPSGWHDLCA
jgi:glutamyl-tRNA reductase